MENNELILRVHIPYWDEYDSGFEIDGIADDEVLQHVAGLDSMSEEVVWDINILTGKVLNWNGVCVHLMDKLCDSGSFELLYNGEVIASMENEYVPEFLCIGTEGYGDYICLDVDKTGQIKDWTSVNQSQCYAFFDVITANELKHAGGIKEYFESNFEPYEEGAQVLRPNTLLFSADCGVITLGELIEKFVYCL